jgi:carbamoyltransferase
MVYILGINAYHADSSACLLKDGDLLAAAEEERFRRVKHWAGFPSEAIRYCLSEAGIALNQVDHLAINRNPYKNLGHKISYALRHRPSLDLVTSRWRNRQRWTALEPALRAAFPGESFTGRVHRVPHHDAHLASAFYVSPFREAVVVSLDGFGDFASTAWGVGQGHDLRIDGQVLFPHSLGIFYQALTQYLGFLNYGDEYKVMGLAPYGAPKFMDEMRQIVRLLPDGTFRLNLRFFRHHSEDVPYEWDGGSPSLGAWYTPELEKMLGPARSQDQELTQRHHDIARSVQAMYEEAAFYLLNRLYERYKIPAITLSGGCAYNSVANGRIRQSTPFRDVYIQSAAGDAGGAIGAAYSACHKLGFARSRFVMSHAYWGPEFSDDLVAQLIEDRKDDLLEQGCRVRRVENEAELCTRVAQAIADGKVIGWFQGRMEWGPRALGNRSICCDPRRPDMKDLLNRKIKRRESFRPFAPSVLREAVPGWFEADDDVPFMMKVYQIRAEKRSLIPAVTHVDGSGRLQTVDAKGNPRYFGLIKAFESLTGVPMILNTSFNENEPVVCRPKEALDCFVRTQMDMLALGSFLIERVSVQEEVAPAAPARLTQAVTGQ